MIHTRRLTLSCIALALTISMVWAPRILAGSRPSLRLRRTSGKIRVDGNLSDPGWKDADRISTFYEVSPADNTAPPVRTTAWITYDSRYVYIAFRCEDPDPSAIRMPFTERDGLSSNEDFVGVLFDARNSHLTAQEFFLNPRGIQSDGTRNDATGQEDFSPDFFWDGAARVTSTGWDAEFRIPLSSLRYPKTSPQTWGVIFVRNYPRDNRYQIWSVKIPRGANCIQCREMEFTGITGLPAGGNWTVAPYVTGKERGYARGVPGTSFRNLPVAMDGGVDAKWTPDANTALDFTLNPDFSQVESDVAQVTENQRFALFYPEKRPFFMEGVDLFQTPIQAVYTRTITSPRWGARITGKAGEYSYTLLTAQDRGGGSIVEPGPESSQFLPQDFGSMVTIGRLRRDIGRSYLGFLFTDRENQGNGSNRVVGPDFQWNPDERNQITGQYLFSTTQVPDRPDISSSWDGRNISAGALSLQWNYSTTKWNSNTSYTDVGANFRAQDGFVPQVGYRQLHQWIARNWYPDNFFTWVGPYLNLQQSWQESGGVLTGRWAVGTEFKGKRNLYGDMTAVKWEQRVGPRIFTYHNGNFTFNWSPGDHLTSFSIYGDVGQQVDFDNIRLGNGGTVQYGFTYRPIDRLSFIAEGEHDWLNVTNEAGRRGRLFTADVARLKTLLSFSAKSYIRAIVQWVNTDRDPALYTYSVARRSSSLQGSLLYSYRLNWQSVLYVGYGDDRSYVPGRGIRPAEQQFFFKISYAFQR